MASSEKKRAREQSAAERRDRAANKRTEKAAVRSATRTPAQRPEPVLPADREE